MTERLLRRIAGGRTDLVVDFLRDGGDPLGRDEGGVPLIRWCAYYGDVSAIRFLLAAGAPLAALGENLDLNGAAFHGHWRLVEFLVESGAGVNRALPDTHETPLHSALCSTDRARYDLVVKVLLDHGADPNRATKAGVDTGSFMRDARTRGETPLHRAAAFGDESTVRLLLAAGASLVAQDAFGDTPLSWASWYRRPAPILRLLLFEPHRIHPEHQGLAVNLLGRPSGGSD